MSPRFCQQFKLPSFSGYQNHPNLNTINMPHYMLLNYAYYLHPEIWIMSSNLNLCFLHNQNGALSILNAVVADTAKYGSDSPH